jgi:hypothetical protein
MSKTCATFGWLIPVVLDQVRVDALDGYPLLKAARAIHAAEMHGRHAADADLVDHAVAAQEVGPRLVARLAACPGCGGGSGSRR